MRAAIIGLPQSGKTTVFQAVTGLSVPVHEVGREHLGVVSVPEPRLEFLGELYNPKKLTEATIEVVDVPGLSLADARGQEEMRKHLPAVRQSELLVAVIRDFKDRHVPPYRDRVDPAADLEELWSEFLFADLDAVTTRVEKLEKALSKPTRTHDQEKKELALLERCREGLEQDRPLSEVLALPDDRRALASFAFLTEKPMVVVYNVSEDRLGEPPPEVPKHAVAAIRMSARTESDVLQLDPQERAEFLAELGIESTARDRLIRTTFDALGLISFLTAGGPEEARAWSIPSGTTAVDAAGKIHTDLARGFIRAEVVAYDDLKATGDMRSAKAAGLVRQEGKNYLVRDGDVILFKFNV